ncbi:OB-fold-containig protein [Dongia sp.]|uniref:OB-fold-containig protein n=1 Tax=Dongia sp. TaxID=1977262 RepID=UPI0035AEA631
MNDGSALEFILGPGTRPFAVSGLILIGLLVIEVISMTMGVSLSAKIDALFDIDTPDAPDLDHGAVGGSGLDIHAAEGSMFGTAWDWLNAGRVPLLVWAMALLAAFTTFGYVIQAIAHLLVGFLPAGMVAVPSVILAVPLARNLSRLIGHVVPRDESYAISRDDLVGLTGIVSMGPVTDMEIGRVTLKDAYGNKHFPWVRAASSGITLDNGAVVLLTERRGTEYLVIAADPKLVA